MVPRSRREKMTNGQEQEKQGKKGRCEAPEDISHAAENSKDEQSSTLTPPSSPYSSDGLALLLARCSATRRRHIGRTSSAFCRVYTPHQRSGWRYCRVAPPILLL